MPIKINSKTFLIFCLENLNDSKSKMTSLPGVKELIKYVANNDFAAHFLKNSYIAENLDKAEECLKKIGQQRLDQ